MPTAFSLLNPIVIAIVIGAGLTAYLWLVHRKKTEVAGGIAALTAMRWREFSQFVIQALNAQGFEASSLEAEAERGPQPDLSLTREGQTWLLSCKQSAHYRISSAQVSELADAVRFEGAAGGILATLGRFQVDARRHTHGLELLDGPALWALIGPLLPPSVHQDLEETARNKALRNIVLAWLVAILIGVVAAAGMRMGSPATPSPSSPSPLSSQPAPVSAPGKSDGVPADNQPAQQTDALLVPPLSEEEQRAAVARDLSAVPGVDRAIWSTRSTLLIYLNQDNPQVIGSICSAMDAHQDLRASRLQLQPPAESTTAVRFMQCHPF